MNVSLRIFKKEQKVTFLGFKVISQINDYSFRINTVYKKILKYLFVIRKNVLYSILLEYKNVKSSNALQKSKTVRMCCISKIIKDRTFFLFAIDS